MGATLIAKLEECKPVEHSGTKGGSTEDIWIELFTNYLPKRFRIERGFVVDHKGQKSKQIDCVIFDGQFTPQIIPKKESLYIPAEAVHAIFETKQTVNAKNLEDAAQKIESVRNLERTSYSYTGDGEQRGQKENFYIIGGLLASSAEYSGGLSNEKLLSNIRDAQSTAHLDFIFSAKDGFMDLMKSENFKGARRQYPLRNDRKPFIVDEKTAISYGLMRLLEELTWQGTVPAIDWLKYLNNLAEPKTIEIPIQTSSKSIKNNKTKK